jgi:hypothetical protein
MPDGVGPRELGDPCWNHRRGGSGRQGGARWMWGKKAKRRADPVACCYICHEVDTDPIFVFVQPPPQLGLWHTAVSVLIMTGGEGNTDADSKVQTMGEGTRLWQVQPEKYGRNARDGAAWRGRDD